MTDNTMTTTGCRRCSKPATMARRPIPEIEEALRESCRWNTKRRRIATTRPYGDCTCTCGRAAEAPAAGSGFDGRISRTCQKRIGYQEKAKLSYIRQLLRACSGCGEESGKKVDGSPWGRPGPLCTACANDCRDDDLSPVDDPDTYLPTPEEIKAECAKILAARTPHDWLAANQEHEESLQMVRSFSFRKIS